MRRVRGKCRGPRQPGLNIGYARVSTDQQDLTAQRDGLQALSEFVGRSGRAPPSASA